MTEKGKVFRAVRTQVLLIRGLEKQMSKSMTEKEKKYFDSKLRIETQNLILVEKKAREYMDNMKPAMYAFCVMYYINALSLDAVAEAIERSTRQCIRYKDRIEKD